MLRLLDASRIALVFNFRMDQTQQGRSAAVDVARTYVHQDDGDLREGFGVMTVLSAGSYDCRGLSGVHGIQNPYRRSLRLALGQAWRAAAA